MRRESGLLPHPVRTAHTAIQGFEDGSNVLWGSKVLNFGPAALTRSGKDLEGVIRHVAVSKHDLVDRLILDNLLKIRFAVDRNTVWIEGSRQFRRIYAFLDVRNLRRCEGGRPAFGRCLDSRY